jgi:perosamine synthetase
MICPSSTARSPREYTENVRGAFARLKRATEAGDLEEMELAGGGVLRPVAELHAGDGATIAAFARWREEAAFAFPDRFEITTEGTARWLRTGLLDAEDRMLWIVLGRDGRAIGHLGYANALNDRRELEIDNVIRGERGADPGVMGAAMRAMTAWARRTLAPETISLKVLADNLHARSFYRRLGWEEQRRIPLRRSVEPGGVYFDEADDGAAPDCELVRMVLPV